MVLAINHTSPWRLRQRPRSTRATDRAPMQQHRSRWKTKLQWNTYDPRGSSTAAPWKHKKKLRRSTVGVPPKLHCSLGRASLQPPQSSIAATGARRSDEAPLQPRPRSTVAAAELHCSRARSIATQPAAAGAAMQLRWPFNATTAELQQPPSIMAAMAGAITPHTAMTAEAAMQLWWRFNTATTELRQPRSRSTPALAT